MSGQLMLPLLAMVFLVLLVWIKMLIDRVSEIRAKRINPQKLAYSSAVPTLLSNLSSAENFENLCELPILFYLGCMLAMLWSLNAPALIPLAWLFVASRYAHSLIHCTSNKVMFRFFAYLVGGGALILFWIMLVIDLMRLGE